MSRVSVVRIKFNLEEDLKPINCMCMCQNLTERCKKAVKKMPRFTEKVTPKIVNNIGRQPWLLLRESAPEGVGGGGYFKKNWVGLCGTLPETLTLFQTKICDFPYPISDLTLNNTLFQACLITSSPGQTNVKCNVYTLLWSRIQNCTKFRA